MENSVCHGKIWFAWISFHPKNVAFRLHKTLYRDLPLCYSIALLLESVKQGSWFCPFIIFGFVWASFLYDSRRCFRLFSCCRFPLLYFNWMEVQAEKTTSNERMKDTRSGKKCNEIKSLNRSWQYELWELCNALELFFSRSLSAFVTVRSFCVNALLRCDTHARRHIHEVVVHTTPATHTLNPQRDDDRWRWSANLIYNKTWYHSCSV